MKHASFLCLLVAGMFSVWAQEKPDRLKPFQGVWKPVQAELGGQPFPPAVLKTITLRIKGDKYEVTVEGTPEPDKGKWTIDPAAKPKRMTITGTEGPNRDKTFPAIYEFGEDKNGDTMRICYDLSGKKHPVEFKTAKGTQHYLVTYMREKE